MDASPGVSDGCSCSLGKLQGTSSVRQGTKKGRREFAERVLSKPLAEKRTSGGREVVLRGAMATSGAGDRSCGTARSVTKVGVAEGKREGDKGEARSGRGAGTII